MNSLHACRFHGGLFLFYNTTKQIIMQFNKGDKVRRKQECGSHDRVVAGEVYTVKSCYNNILELEEVTGQYHIPYFTLEEKLIETTQTETYEIY